MRDQIPRVKWPRSFPVCALLGVAISLVLTAGAAIAQLRLMQPLQRLYFVPFLKASVLPFPLTVKLVEVHAPGRGYMMAVDPWIAVSHDGDRLVVGVTKTAASAGITNPRIWVAKDIKPQGIRPFFATWIYHGSALMTLRPMLVAFCIFFAGGLLVGAWFDEQHREAVRRGIQIRGPRLMAPKKAQKYLKGDGIALFLDPRTR